MSADNGIYIAKFPIDQGKSGYFEYRVVHTQNIEDCYYSDSFPKLLTDATIVIVFGNAKIFYSKDKAISYANKLYDEIMNSECPIVEYGISEIEFKNPIDDISISKAKSIVDRYWKSIQTSASKSK